MPVPPRATCLWQVALFLAGLSAGCATLPYAKVEGALARQDLAAARAALADGENQYGSKARLLYLMDQAMLAHYDRDWRASAEAVEKAQALIDELYAVSLSQQAASLVVNDMSVAYKGEDHERVMLNVLGLLARVALGDRDAALVEARRGDERMKQHVKDREGDQAAYREDALMRYLSAVLYEAGSRQELWDAWLDYKKADEAFDDYAKLYGTPKPKRLKTDLQRMAAGLKEEEALKAYQARDGALDHPSLSQTRGKRAEAVVLLYEGLAPVKVSKTMHLPLQLDDGTKQYFSLALPEFQGRMSPTLLRARLSSGAEQADFELFQDLDRIAVKDLELRSGRLVAKATARALSKFQAARALQKEAKKSGGDGAELLAILGTNLFSLATEHADIRSWRTLPGRIYVARLLLDPGPQSLEVVLPGRQDPVLPLGEVDLKEGEKRFFSCRIP